MAGGPAVGKRFPARAFPATRRGGMQDDNPDRPGRGQMTAIAISVALAMIVFFAVAAFAVLHPDSTFYLRDPQHRRVAIDRGTGQTVFAVILGSFALAATVVACRMVRTLRALPVAEAEDTLPAGETLRWIGRPGWRTFRGPRAVVLPIALGLLILLGMWLQSSATGATGFGEGLRRMFFPLMVTLCYAVPVLVMGLPLVRTWLRDMFGHVSVTRSRVVWISPLRRAVYREVAGDRIVDAWRNADSGERGSITLVTGEPGDVRHVYLDHLPDPDGAFAAVEHLARYS